MQIRQVSAQDVSDYEKCAFDIGRFHFVGLFCDFFAIEANPSSHFRAIFRNQSHGHEFEQHSEFELLLLVRGERTRDGGHDRRQ